MTSRSVITAAIGAVVGAAGWTAWSVAADQPIGPGACLAGLLAAAGVRLAGGTGRANGVICVLLSIGLFMAAKAASDRLRAPAKMRKAVESRRESERERFDERVRKAAAFVALDTESEDGIRAFMVRFRIMTEQLDPADVTVQEIADFKQFAAPNLQAFYESRPAFEEWWHEARERDVKALTAQYSLSASAWLDAQPLEVGFFVFGTVMAYVLGARRKRNGDVHVQSDAEPVIAQSAAAARAGDGLAP